MGLLDPFPFANLGGSMRPIHAFSTDLRYPLGRLLAVATLLLASLPARAVDLDNTRMLRMPAVSADHIAFVYAHDLWLANRDGSAARRLTSHPGIETNPRFSPDGRTLAFSAQYDGNIDVFIVPVEGGEPRRLTWHPDPDQVQGFTPDGGEVLFISQRAVHTNRYSQLFTVAITGGFPKQLEIPNAAQASYSPDGRKIAYLPVGQRSNQWKNYRGGTTSRIWIYDIADHSIEEVPQPPGRCNDSDPVWIDGTLYFRSDRDGEFNLYSFGPDASSVRRLTQHEDFPVLSVTSGGGALIYEQAAVLHLFDPTAGQVHHLNVGVAADLAEARPRYASDPQFLRSFHLSPSGARLALGYRGEIVTVPAEKGHPRNLTQSPGAHERSPVWSPDGSQIAYVSDASGEYELRIEDQDGKGEVHRYPLDGAGFYEDLHWAPDGEKISFTDNSWSLYWIDLTSGSQEGTITRISSEPYYGPIKTLHHNWSPDSRWLVYTRNSASSFQTAHLYSLDDGQSHAITDGLSDIGEPVFDAGGKYIWLTASTDSGPVRQWFAQSNADDTFTNDLYLMVLSKDEKSPLAQESDEEEGSTEDDSDDSDDDHGEEGEDSKEGSDAPPPVNIDLDGLGQRILAVPTGTGSYSSLSSGKEGQLLYLKSARGRTGETPTLYSYDLAKREETELLSGVDFFAMASGGEKVAVMMGDTVLIASTGGAIDASEGRVDIAAVEIKIDPRAEWPQILREAWRMNRDYFYDPGMHGADWPAMWERYSAFLPDLAVRSDLNRLIQWMSSELSVGHHFVFGGDTLTDLDPVAGGLLGADYEIDHGRYRFAKVFGGLNWNPDLRSPLTEPGVNVKAGEYLLQVEGRDLLGPENLYSRFENTAGKIVEITVGLHPDGRDSRTVQVTPIADEGALRNRDWVEGNLKRVTEATDGRVAYVYVPDTAGRGHTYFKRYFYPQAQREAIIVDERHNGGGSVADYYIDILRRPFISYWATRYGNDLESPISAIHGPKVMLIDETAGSGGDLLPWMFHKLEIGTLVGKRTWGGLVGILGFPILMDGGFVTAPNIAIWTPEGFVVENVGVPPDIEVEQLPSEVIQGRDPQLEKAIEIALEQLEANPRVRPERPPFPVRARP